jgi:hypothetical protein
LRIATAVGRLGQLVVEVVAVAFRAGLVRARECIRGRRHICRSQVGGRLQIRIRRVGLRL